MEKLETSGTDDFRSPIEERHIDFILEEEFVANPAFLDFFLHQAGTTASNVEIPARKHGGASEAFRSATTSAGETDVLVRYLCVQDSMSGCSVPTMIRTL